MTIPIDSAATGGIDGSQIDLELRNAGAYSYTLASVCISETQRVQAPTDCILYNYDFITSTIGWDSIGALSWTGLEGNGSAYLEPFMSEGLIAQDLDANNIVLRGAYDVTARIKASTLSTTTVYLWAQHLDVEFYDKFMTEYTTTIGTDWENVSADFYMTIPPNMLGIESDNDIIVDWICVSKASGGDDWRPPIPICKFPTFADHPDFSITSLLIASVTDNWFWWFAVKVGDMLQWLVCSIKAVFLTVVSMLMDMGSAVGISIPETIDIEDVTIGSLLMWLRETVRSIMTWFWTSLSNFVLSGKTFGEWLGSIVVTIAEWFWDDIVVELIEWAFDQAVAAGLIGEDAADRILWMFRDVDIWLAAAADEADYEFDSALLLLEETVSVFGVLLEGMRTGLTGEEVLDMGEDLGGFAAYLWRGVEFINDVVAATPLSGLNIVALGTIFWGLATWTTTRVGKMLELLV